MASFRGTVRRVFQGVEHALTLNMNSFAEFEEMTGLDYKAAFGPLTARQARALVGACLAQHNEDATLKLAGELLSEFPDLILQLFTAAAPSASEQERLGN